jgi:hypothetical protein
VTARRRRTVPAYPSSTERGSSACPPPLQTPHDSAPIINRMAPGGKASQSGSAMPIKHPAAEPATAPGTHAGEAESPTPSADRAALGALLLQAVLEEKRVINWWVVETVGGGNGNMEPLRVAPIDGDGNCLLNAASDGLTSGDHTFPLATELRKALHREMTGPRAGIYRKRWETALAARNQGDGFELDASQWNTEWAALEAAAATTRTSLQEVHIFLLAHVLRRPIIVFSSKVCPCM